MRLPKLTRRGRIVRNLAVILASGVLLTCLVRPSLTRSTALYRVEYARTFGPSVPVAAGDIPDADTEYYFGRYDDWFILALLGRSGPLWSASIPEHGIFEVPEEGRTVFYRSFRYLWGAVADPRAAGAVLAFTDKSGEAGQEVRRQIAPVYFQDGLFLFYLGETVGYWDLSLDIYDAGGALLYGGLEPLEE